MGYTKIDVRNFLWNKEENRLTAYASDLKPYNIDTNLRSREPLEIVGQREVRRYVLHETRREPSRNEIGDVIAWVFIPVSGHMIRIPGPELHILND